MRTRWMGLAGTMALMLVAACGSKGGLSFEQFVNATVELRRAVDQTKTPAEFAARKQSIQQRLGVNDRQLQEFVESHRTDMKLMSAAWDSVEARLGRAGQKDAATRPTPQPPPIPAAGGPAALVPPAQVGPDARGSGAAPPPPPPPGTPASRHSGPLPPPQTAPARQKGPAPQKAVRF